MGFDIAVVVAIDLVLAVGLLQIQNCLDSDFVVYFDLAAVERSVGKSTSVVFVPSSAAVPFALVHCLCLCCLWLLVVANANRYLSGTKRFYLFRQF